jgi:type II secretory pathway component PulC
VLEFAVREAVGLRAPPDKFSRSVHRTRAGLAAGDFIVEINGRRFADAETVVVCEKIADVRFFLTRRRAAIRT